MQPYDEKTWQQLEERGNRSRRQGRTILPERLRDIRRDVVVRGKDGFDHLPGSDQLQGVVEDVMRGAVSTVGALAAASVVQGAVLRRYERHGYPVDALEAIRELDLQVSDAIFPRRRRLMYMCGSAAEGALAGAFSSASEVGTAIGGVAGAGAGAVPGALALAGVLALDALATVSAAARVVAWTAALYGYDPNDPGEELFMASVLGVATAGSQSAKMAAQWELNQVSGLLARRATKAVLSEASLARVLPKVWPRLVESLTHRQLGKAVPAFGVVLGATLNASLMKRVSDEAYFAYRGRRLRDRYGEEHEHVLAPDEPFRKPLVLDLLGEDDDDLTTRDAA